jgi:MFS family permease
MHDGRGAIRRIHFSGRSRLSSAACRTHTASSSSLYAITAAVFIVYLVIGLAMPVLPLHVHQGLGFGTFVVGLVAGCQFGAALLTRIWAGRQADARGGKRVLLAGLVAAVASGLLYLLSFRFIADPLLSVSILLAGRALLGAAESFIIMGTFAWGLPLAGPANIGRMMSWVGVAMYVAYALGAPVGARLYASHGFGWIGAATVLIPLVAIALVAPVPAVPPAGGRAASLRHVLARIWLPGIGLALTAVGFGAITTFTPLVFLSRGWHEAWIALSAVSAFFVLPRLVAGHLPDRLGGPRLALVCALVEAGGLLAMWIAPTSAVAIGGAALAGLGYSLIYPSFGVEALRHVSPQDRGAASGAYTAFLDLALGTSGPLLGLVASRASVQEVYLASALVVTGAAVVAGYILRSADRAFVPAE